MTKEDFTWKRIQTVFIVIAAGLLVSMLACNMCHTIIPKGDDADVIKFTDRYQFMVFSFTTFALCTVIIGYYKQRIIQMRLCILNSIMLFFYQLWILFEFFLKKYDGVSLHDEYALTVAAVFPAIAIILLLVAAKFIGQDEIRFTVANAMAQRKGSGKAK